MEWRKRARAGQWRCTQRAIAILAVALGMAGAARAEDFESALARVDRALETNPRRVSEHALESCLHRRNFAAKLYDRGEVVRAERGLAYCFQLLGISEQPAADEPVRQISVEEVKARAAREIEQALALSPDPRKGLEIYRECALCHTPEGWGLQNGSVPQLAGQHRTVVIKQLADIRAGHRDNPNMLPYASAAAIGGAQAIADVADYIDTLEISVENGKGPGTDLERGEALYQEGCARCHGVEGQGSRDGYIPRIQAQHFNYLVSQLEAIRNGTRRNANPEMAAQVQALDEREVRLVLDYVSRLQPPPEFQAPPGWRNPDFPDRTHYDPPAPR